MNKEIVAACQRFCKYLRQTLDYEQLTGVGMREVDDQWHLIVYSKYKKTVQNVPAEFEGYPVEIRITGVVKPA